MDMSFVLAEQTVTSMDTKKEDVSYEHKGYQVRVHFNGSKTLRQCIQNLAERQRKEA